MSDKSHQTIRQAIQAPRLPGVYTLRVITVLDIALQWRLGNLQLQLPLGGQLGIHAKVRLGSQVGNYSQFKSFWGHVEDLDGPNPTYSADITKGASDLGGQVHAAPMPHYFPSRPPSHLEERKTESFDRNMCIWTAAIKQLCWNEVVWFYGR